MWGFLFLVLSPVLFWLFMTVRVRRCWRKVISIINQYNKVWDMLDNTEAPGLLVVPFG